MSRFKELRSTIYATKEEKERFRQCKLVPSYLSSLRIARILPKPLSSILLPNLDVYFLVVVNCKLVHMLWPPG